MRLETQYDHVDNWTFIDTYMSGSYHNGFCLHYDGLLFLYNNTRTKQLFHGLFHNNRQFVSNTRIDATQ